MNKISGPAFLYKASQGTEIESKILQSQLSVAKKQTQGLAEISTLENVLVPQLPCIKKVQPQEAVVSHPRHQIRVGTYVDTRMLARN